jgi:hypothetical protein
MSVIKKPDLTDPKLRAKLAKEWAIITMESLHGQMIFIYLPLTMLGALACVGLF